MEQLTLQDLLENYRTQFSAKANSDKASLEKLSKFVEEADNQLISLATEVLAGHRMRRYKLGEIVAELSLLVTRPQEIPPIDERYAARNGHRWLEN